MSRIEDIAPGAESEQVLAAVIRQAKADDPLAPVTVVVPSFTVALSLRQRLADLGPVAGVRFTELSRLIEMIGAPRGYEVDGGGLRVPATGAAVLAAARAALAEAPGILRPVADHPATAASLASTYRAVRSAGESDLSALSSSSGRARDVVGLITRMRSQLETLYYDLHDLTEAATSVLETLPAAGASGTGAVAASAPGAVAAGAGVASAPGASTAGAFGASVPAASTVAADIGLVVVYLPAPLPPAAVSFLSAMAARLPVVVLAGRSGDELADRSVRRLVDALVACGSFERDASHGSTAPARFAGVVNAPDEDEEARSAVRLLLAHAETGGDLGRCIVTYPFVTGSDGVSGVAARVCRQMDEAGIPWSGPHRQRLADCPHGRLLRCLVELSAPREKGREIDRGEVMRLLSSGPVAVGRGLTAGLSTSAGGAYAPAGEPQLMADLAARVNGGAADGAPAREHHPAVAVELPLGAWDRVSCTAGVVSGIDEWRERLGGFAQRLRERHPDDSRLPDAADLGEVVERLWALVSRAATCTSWIELTNWCLEAVGELLDPGEARDELEEAVGDLGTLDAVEALSGLAPHERFDHFGQAVESVLERPSTGGRGRFGVGPTVGPLASVAGCRSEVLLVLGCAEGELPARRRDDPLLPMHERERVAALAEPESAEEQDRRHLVSLVAASEHAVALFARVDVAAARGRYRSRWLDHDLFDGAGDEVPSFAGALNSVLSGSLPAASEADYELALLSTPDGRRHFTGILSSFDGDYGWRLRAERERSAARGLSRFSGYLGQRSDQLWRDVHSATALEDFAACPVRFFFSYLLDLRQLDAPERVATIEPRERGSLVHTVLERFFDPVDGREGEVPVLDPAALNRLEQIAEEEFRHYETSGKTGKRINWDIARDQILRDLRLFVGLEVERAKAGSYVPQAVELCFGRNGAPPLVIEAAGREVKFSGQIDRVDRAPGGQTVVVDYKTGKADRFKEISKDPLGRGRHLQLPLYAKAVARASVDAPEEPGSPPVRAQYRFASAVAGFAIVDVELDEALDEQFTGVLSTLVSTIDSGSFPPRPGEPVWPNRYENCSFCDFNSVCTTDRAELWERASRDDRIRDYADLVAGRGEDVP